MIDRELAWRLRSEGKTLREISFAVGCSKEYVRQMVLPCPRCACGRRIHKYNSPVCSRCFKATPKPRLPCRWCGRPGGTKRDACLAHMGKWHYVRYRELHMASAKRHWQKVKKGRSK